MLQLKSNWALIDWYPGLSFNSCRFDFPALKKSLKIPVIQLGTGLRTFAHHEL